MMSDQNGIAKIRPFGLEAESVLRERLSRRATGSVVRMYGMLEYFLGFRDSSLSPKDEVGGKRFRPALCLYLANEYGAKQKAVSAAAAIELFHNFTLIHDDIVDKDEMRRGRPTVWKLWGVDHALNSGDAQSLMASELVAESSRETSALMAERLFNAFIQVSEGQYLDFELTKLSLREVSEKMYLEMIHKKTATLVGVSAEAAGIAAEKGAEELEQLRIFGENLGLAYQIADDYRSVWSEKEETGKDALGDIREKKRALPILVLYASLPQGDQLQIDKIFDANSSPSEDDVRYIKNHFDASDCRALLKDRVEAHLRVAKAALRKLTIAEDAKNTLESAAEEFTRVV